MRIRLLKTRTDNTDDRKLLVVTGSIVGINQQPLQEVGKTYPKYLGSLQLDSFSITRLRLALRTKDFSPIVPLYEGDIIEVCHD